MNLPLFLFCGGPSLYGDGVPKPLMKVHKDLSLLRYFLHDVEQRPELPSCITLLCDDGQQAAFEADVQGLHSPVPIRVLACGPQASTLEKLERALQETPDGRALVQFGYPDIFFFGEPVAPDFSALAKEPEVHVSAAALTSRFPRLIVDTYNNEVKGISNYSGAVPANPMYVFGGDLWCRVGAMRALLQEFGAIETVKPSLEYDFFFWLVNHQKMRCVILRGERLWVDSQRDIHQLLYKTQGLA